MTESADSSDSIQYFGETKERAPRVAVPLTLLCPGLGYMYVGHVLKGFVSNLLLLLMLAGGVMLFSILKFFPLLPFAVLATAWLTFSAFAAHSVYRECTRVGDRYVLKGYNHWTLYALALLMTYLLPIYGTGELVSSYLLGLERAENSAMFPTIHADDVVLIDKSAYRKRKPRRGDLVSVTTDDEVRILRVVAVEGDVVRIEGETVFVNGEPLERSELGERVPSLDGDADLLAMVETNHGSAYVISVSPRAFSAHTIPPQKLGTAQLFVLADNRSQISPNRRSRIRDSRDFGPVPVEAVNGEPLYIAWSSEGSGVAWERVGLRTQ